MVLFYQRRLLKAETLFAPSPRKGFVNVGRGREITGLWHVLSRRKRTASLQISHAALRA